jgi:hypothetical protein
MRYNICYEMGMFMRTRSNVTIQKFFRTGAFLSLGAVLFTGFQNFTSNSSPAIGAYVDGDSSFISSSRPTKEANLEQLEKYLGIPTNTLFALEYGNNNSWPELQSGIHWSVEGWHNANPNRRMNYSIPLTMNNIPLAWVAAGNYDTYFIEAAQVVAKYYPNSIIRIGWEFNGDWMPWKAAGHEQDYINAFRRVAKIFKGVSAGFTIDWCPNEGVQSVDPELVYPGDDVVDIIGMDYYDDNWNTSAERWAFHLTEPRGLNWHAQFAATHAKPMSYPEFGSGKSGDDPYFVAQMNAWVLSHNVLYAQYWSSNSAYPGEMQNNAYPLIGNMFAKTFGLLATEFGNPPTPLPPVPSPTPAPLPPPASGACAQEGGFCSFAGTELVRYGANGIFVTKFLTGGTACTNAVFGDPLPSIGKACYLGVGASGGVASLQNLASGLCLDVPAGNTENGVQVMQWNCHSGANQKFLISKDADGSLSLQNMQSSKCLDIENGSAASGTKLQQWDCASGNPNQKFRLVSQAGGRYQLMASGARGCVQPASSSVGTNVTEQPCSASDPLQSFTLIFSSGSLP